MATNREVEVLGCTSEEFVHDVCRMLESSIFDGVDFVEENLIQEFRQKDGDVSAESISEVQLGCDELCKYLIARTQVGIDKFETYLINNLFVVPDGLDIQDEESVSITQEELSEDKKTISQMRAQLYMLKSRRDTLKRDKLWLDQNVSQLEEHLAQLNEATSSSDLPELVQSLSDKIGHLKFSIETMREQDRIMSSRFSNKLQSRKDSRKSSESTEEKAT